MKKEDLTTWFNDEFWPLYQSFVKTPFPTKYKAGTKGEALKKILRENPSSDLRDRMLSAVREQIKHRKTIYNKAGSAQRYNEITAYQKFYSNRHAVTWLNQMGWEDEIPGTTEVEELESGNEIKAKICCHKDCNEPTEGQGIDWCFEHYPDTLGYTKMMKDWLKKHGLWKTKEETIEQWQARCKADSMTKLKAMGVLR
jgi:hypothetical protein